MVRSLAAEGWECHIVFPSPSPIVGEFDAVGARSHVIGMRRLTTSGGFLYYMGYVVRWPISVLRLRRLARRIDPGIVHTNSLHSWYGWAVAALLHKPHLWHAREIVVQSRWALRVERWLCRRFASRVLAVSKPVAAQLHPSNVIVVHDVVGPEDGLSPELAGRFRDRIGIADGVPLVGAAGRIDTWKGFDVLLAAAPGIRRRRPDAQLVVAGGQVAGKEDYADRLAEEATRIDGVHWLGPRQDMPDLLADLDLLVVPSTEPEPFAAVAVEALATGVPVAATDHGGSPEMLADLPPGTGALFSPRHPDALTDAVVAILPEGPSSVERRRGRKPLCVGEPFTVSAVLEELLAAGR
jgi:glycosyltransferase involved in cell wall biosynthesis